MSHRVRLAVIVGSTREGRFADTIVRWFLAEARQREDLEIDLLDLAEAELPAIHQREPSPAVRAFARRIEAADGFVVVTPEYNHGYPAALKFAIDSVQRGWRAKPVGFVSYGGVSGGLRAVEQLRQVFAELHAVSVRDGVSFASAHSLFDSEGRLTNPSAPGEAAARLMNQLVWWAEALREARAKRPYGT